LIRAFFLAALLAPSVALAQGAQQAPMAAPKPSPHIATAFSALEAARQLLLDAAGENVQLQAENGQLQAQVAALKEDRSKQATAKDQETISQLSDEVADLKAQLQAAKADGDKRIRAAQDQCEANTPHGH
jgi:hypothetical protein